MDPEFGELPSLEWRRTRKRGRWGEEEGKACPTGDPVPVPGESPRRRGARWSYYAAFRYETAASSTSGSRRTTTRPRPVTTNTTMPPAIMVHTMGTKATGFSVS
jgi:hypothetical protein